MIVPSIDLMGGQAVGLVGGKQRAIVDGDPRDIAARYALAGEMTLVDIDRAFGQGDNAALVTELMRFGPCRVGGGIRSVDEAIRWLDAGAAKVILGTAATPDVLRQLPRDRVIAAIDALEGEVVVDAWRKPTGVTIAERMRELSGLVAGFLVTFVERAGRVKGIDMAEVREVIRQAGGVPVTVGGGIATTGEIAAIDRLGADAAVGLALSSGAIDLADAITAPLVSDRPDGLFPTVVCDEHGIALGLAYSDAESLREAVRRRRGVYHSRTRGLWVKGESSGATQTLTRIALDCDRDALRFTVTQDEPGFCHKDTRTCWGQDGGFTRLARTLAARMKSAPAGSYSKRLFEEKGLLEAKLLEEAGELAEATDPEHVAAETADVIYFALVAAARAGVPLAAVEAHIDRRSLRVTRRKGDAKKKPEGQA